MPTPSIPDWESMNFAEGDTVEAIEKQNAQNEALQTFSTQLVNYVEESAEALLTSGGKIFPTVAEGLVAAENDGYFYAENPDPNISKTLYQRISASESRKVADDPSAEFVESIALNDAISINSGKNYPLKAIIRDGVLSEAGSRNYNEFLIDAKVYGPSKSIEGYYFRIGYFQNDVSVGVTQDKGVMIQRLPIATYSTNSDPEIIHHYADSPIDFVRGSGVQTVVIRPDRTLEPIEIYLTIDTDKVYPAGQFIDSREPGSPSGSWIIDTSCYVSNDAVAYDSLTVNRGKPYPLAKRNIGGVVSGENSDWSKLILDAYVVGAERGKLYQISYYQNGGVIGSAGYGWVIRERDAADLDTDTGDGIRIENRDNPDEVIDRNGGIQTISIVPALRPGIEIKITVDADQLPPDGVAITSNDNTRDGWSWVIDPSRYAYRNDIVLPSLSNSNVTWNKAGSDLAVSYFSNGHYYRITFGLNGFNNLPNFKKVEISTDAFNWTNLVDSPTDWLPPIQVQAVNNGDGGSKIYTGGNHGSSGSAGGSQTARNVHYSISPDNYLLTSDGSGYANAIIVTVVNEVMAYNTITTERYVMRESYKLVFSVGGVSVTAKRQFYEDVILGNDNGLQATTSAYENVGTYMIYGGQQGRAVFDANRVGAGAASSYPDAWATVFLEPGAGQFVVWMDREFGAGAGTLNPSTYVRFGSGTNWKIYNNVAGFDDFPLSAGDEYSWRGGYGWSMPSSIADIDSMFTYRNGGEIFAAYAVDNEDWWSI
ncbi:hypothetical protein [Halomonas sp. MS1]|nr:hypothetical protein [Halomonas sp. MS1]UTD54910.1 hypothetical protein NF683_17450 [Halomonas sp. MS1]